MPESEITPQVMTLKEVADYLRLPQEKVRELVVKEGLIGRRIADEWRFLKAAIDNWLRQKDARPIEAATTFPDVLTLGQAAEYLRVSESDVLEAMESQRLHGRKIGSQWRFHKSALQKWVMCLSQGERLMQLAGFAKDDPYMDEMLENIYKERGRPMVEE